MSTDQGSKRSPYRIIKLDPSIKTAQKVLADLEWVYQQSWQLGYHKEGVNWETGSRMRDIMGSLIETQKSLIETIKGRKEAATK